MRRSLTLTLALLVVAPAAFAATHAVKLPTVFSKQLATLHAKGVGPILLPETMPIGAKQHVYPSVATGEGGY
jgi:hypothetical protein